MFMTFKANAKAPFKLAILIKESAMSEYSMKQYYVDPLIKGGHLKKKDVIVLSLKYENGKALSKASKTFLANNTAPMCKKLGVTTIAVADSAYFGYLTGQTAASVIGSYCSSNMEEFDGFKIVPLTNYMSIKHNATMLTKLNVSVEALKLAVSGLPKQIGTREVKHQKFPKSVKQIKKSLKKLLKEPMLALDIEGFSLDFTKAQVGSISFSKDKHSAVTFSVDYQKRRVKGEPNLVLYKVLVKFLEKYKGKLVFHRGQYDITVLIYWLFMKYDLDNIKGMLRGIEAFQNIHDTLILTYLATNNCNQNVLNLKDNTIEFSGNYAIDVKDITKHKPKVVLKYNGRDTANTMYLFEKHKYVLETDALAAYNILVDAVVPLCQSELHGMPMNQEESIKLEAEVAQSLKDHIEKILLMPEVRKFINKKRKQFLVEANLESKGKIHKWADSQYEFNVNSDAQVAELLHEYLGLEVMDTTDTGLPSMKVKSLEILRNNI